MQADAMAGRAHFSIGRDDDHVAQRSQGFFQGGETGGMNAVVIGEENFGCHIVCFGFGTTPRGIRFAIPLPS